jgi:hypothetical protein
MEVWDEWNESFVQGNGKSPLDVLRKDLAEFVRVVCCRSMITVPQIRQEILLRCRCLAGLWGTVDTDAVEFLKGMRVDAEPQAADGLGDIAMLTKMRSTQKADKLQNGETTVEEAHIG